MMSESPRSTKANVDEPDKSGTNVPLHGHLTDAQRATDMNAIKHPPKGADTIFSLCFAHVKSQVLFASCNLRIYDVIETEGPDMTSSSLASSMGVPEGNLHRLLRACAAVGLLEEHQDDLGNLTFSNTEESRLHLRHDDPLSLISFLSWHSEFGPTSIGRLTELVRQGHTSNSGSDLYDRLRQGNPSFLRPFNVGMAAVSVPDLHIINSFDHSSYKTAVDCGGGLGVVGRALKQAYRDISVVVLDLPHVIKDARSFWAERNEDPGVEFREGNFFTGNIPTADLYILSHVLHDWTDDKCCSILENIYSILSPGGALLIHDKVYRYDVGCTSDICLDLMMMVANGGKQRTLIEYEDLLSKTGFTEIQFKPNPGENLYDAIFAKKSLTVDRPIDL